MVIQAVADLDNNIFGHAHVVKASGLDSVSVFNRDDRIALVEAQDERALGRKEDQLGEGEDVRILETGNIEHEAGEFAADSVDIPGAHPLLPVRVWGSRVNGDGRVVLSEYGRGHANRNSPVLDEHHGRHLHQVADVGLLAFWAILGTLVISLRFRVETEARQVAKELSWETLTRKFGVLDDVGMTSPFSGVDALFGASDINQVPRQIELGRWRAQSFGATALDHEATNGCSW